MLVIGMQTHCLSLNPLWSIPTNVELIKNHAATVND